MLTDSKSCGFITHLILSLRPRIGRKKMKKLYIPVQNVGGQNLKQCSAFHSRIRQKVVFIK